MSRGSGFLACLRASKRKQRRRLILVADYSRETCSARLVRRRAWPAVTQASFETISASRLFEFAAVLDVSPSHFFDEMTSETSSGKRKPGRLKVKAAGKDVDLNTKRETLELVRAYYKIRDASQRKSVAGLVTALAEK